MSSQIYLICRDSNHHFAILSTEKWINKFIFFQTLTVLYVGCVENWSNDEFINLPVVVSLIWNRYDLSSNVSPLLYEMYTDDGMVGAFLTSSFGPGGGSLARHSITFVPSPSQWTINWACESLSSLILIKEEKWKKKQKEERIKKIATIKFDLNYIVCGLLREKGQKRDRAREKEKYIISVKVRARWTWYDANLTRLIVRKSSSTLVMHARNIALACVYKTTRTLYLCNNFDLWQHEFLLFCSACNWLSLCRMCT